MEIRAHFLQGPNLYADYPMLVIAATFEDNAKWIDLGKADCAENLASPPCATSLAQAWAQAWSTSNGSITDLLIKLTLNLLAEYSVEAKHGYVLQNENHRLQAAIQCDDQQTGVAAWQLACRVIAAQAGEGAIEPVNREYLAFRATNRRRSLNQSTLAMVRAAHRQNIPHYRFRVPGELVQLGQGVHRQIIFETMTQNIDATSLMVSADKLASRRLFLSMGIPALPMIETFSAEDAVRAAETIGFPVVVKPCRGRKGTGVSVYLNSRDEVMSAYAQAARPNDSVIVERFAHGHDHRILVVGGRMIAAAMRLPPEVVGNGVHTIRQLVEIMNRDPLRGSIDYESLMEKVVLDRAALSILAKQGASPDSIPAAGVRVRLGKTANISKGGSAVDVTEKVHPDNRKAAEDAAQALGFDVAGIDFISRDISQSWRTAGGAVLEINSPPGLRPHWLANPEHDVVTPILNHLFPPEKDARIPTAAITGSLGKTTTARMLETILTQQGLYVGVATTQGVWIGGTQASQGDCAGGGYARELLLNPKLEAGVFEIARGGLARSGMVIDACDVGAVLNISDNHLGLDGISTREEMARVKSIVVRSARKMAVLNAEDALCMAMLPDIQAKRICLVSRDMELPSIQQHLESGGCAVVLQQGANTSQQIVLLDKSATLTSIPLNSIPATHNGTAIAKVSNAMFATAIAYGLGVAPSNIGKALAQFSSSYAQNPGRFNFCDRHPFRIILEWADGPVAMAAMAASIDSMKVPGRKLLLLTAAGNRPDDFIVATGRAAAGHFDEYTCCDWDDLRGRNAGETPALLRTGLMDGGVAPSQIELAVSETQCLKQLLIEAQPGDLVVITTYQSHQAWQLINAHKVHEQND